MSDLRAIGLILAAVLCFAVQDVIVKVTAGSISLWQMQLVRSVAVIALLTAVLYAIGRPQDLLPRRLPWPLLRAFFMSIAYLCFYASLPYLSLANAASTFFISPMLITVFAAAFLGEPIGPRRILAVIAGFAGVLLIIRPGLTGWSPIALLPVLAAACYALGVVLTRWRCRQDPGFSLTMVHTVLFASIGLVGVAIIPTLPLGAEMRSDFAFLTGGWMPLSLGVFALLLVTAVTHLLGAQASVRAYQVGEASRLAPFEYTYLVAMGLFDFALWGAVPGGVTLTGMALICASGGFIAWREGRPAQPRIQHSAEIPWTPEHLDRDPPIPSATLEAAPSRNW